MLKICSICNKISGTSDDHLHCQEKRRIELEAEDFKENIPEKIDAAKNSDELNADIKAFINHMIKEKK